ncbi:LOW QUALITY PROTEIN: uncharacterized protein Dwil_GK21466 [Drosophila willistoni]|nr:LOW QUALITY PROTEIN: uncharacterized protein Dwil_GK21466 [Drosophila willistoni]
MTVTSFNLVTKAPTLGVRHLQVLFLFSCGALAIHQRMNLSVGIVAMTNANSSNPNYPEYIFTEQQKSYILGSQFWGSCFTQLIGGYLSSRYGTKILLMCISLITSLLSLATPWAVSLGGWQLLCGVRFLQGLAMGGSWPCFYTHLAKWCPKAERNRLGGIMQTGLDIGTAIGFALSGVLAASPFGWHSIFYVPGFLGLLWCLLWSRYGASSPAMSPFISAVELKYIELAQEQEHSHASTAPPVPWLQIFTSRPYLVLAFCKMSQAFNFYTLMQQIPRYIHGIFRYNIQINALLSALPFVVMCLMSYFFVFLADYLTRRCNIPLVVLRKTINSLASWIPAVALIALSFVQAENVLGSISCMTVAVAAIAGQAIGSALSPNFAGLLFSISNTLMSLAGVISPLIIGLTVENESDRSQWRLVFLGIALILFVGNLMYVIFGRMTVQPWNGPSKQEDSSQDTRQGSQSEARTNQSVEKFAYF